jgi:hypothetical protein
VHPACRPWCDCTRPIIDAGHSHLSAGCWYATENPTLTTPSALAPAEPSSAEVLITEQQVVFGTAAASRPENRLIAQERSRSYRMYLALRATWSQGERIRLR